MEFLDSFVYGSYGIKVMHLSCKFTKGVQILSYLGTKRSETCSSSCFNVYNRLPQENVCNSYNLLPIFNLDYTFCQQTV